jgi:epoxyqueuosine reductase
LIKKLEDITINSEQHIAHSTNRLKAFIHNLGIDIVGIASLTELVNMPVGLNIDLWDLFKRYPFAIVLGAQYGKLGRRASGDETAIYLEKITYEIMGYLENRLHQHLVIHPEDEYDTDNRMGLLSLKVLAKQAGLGWQGRSLLIVSQDYGPIHRLIGILTNMPLIPNEPIQNQCGKCQNCIDNCVRHSLTICQYDDHPHSREEVLDVQACLGDDGCMVCILKCPYL